MLSSRTLKSLALAVAIAALAVPTAQAKPTPAGKYGPLDPAIAAAIRSHQTVQSVPFTTEHAAGQNAIGLTSAVGRYGTLDPAIATAIRNNSDGENGVSRSAAASAPATGLNGFDWSAAGIGATVALTAMLLGLGVARLIPRRSHTRLA